MNIILTQNQFYPETYDITLEIDHLPEVTMDPIHHEGDRTFWYGESNGFVRFGISDNQRVLNHEPGYMWSSRSSVFNGLFSDRCFCTEVDIAVGNHKYWGFAISCYKLLQLLSSEYTVANYRSDDGENRIAVCRADNVPDMLGEHWTFIDDIICGGEHV